MRQSEFCEGSQPPLDVNILLAMGRHEEVATRRQAHDIVDTGRLDPVGLRLEDLEHGVPHDVDPVTGEALTKKVGSTALRVGHQDGTAVIDDSAVDLLGNAVIEAAITGFQMVDRDAHLDRRRSPPGRCSYRRGSRPDRVARCAAAPRPGRWSGRPDPKLSERMPRNTSGVLTPRPEEDLAEERVVVLAGVDEDLFTVRVERRDNPGQPDDLRPRPEYGHESFMRWFAPMRHQGTDEWRAWASVLHLWSSPLPALT